MEIQDKDHCCLLALVKIGDRCKIVSNQEDAARIGIELVCTTFWTSFSSVFSAAEIETPGVPETYVHLTSRDSNSMLAIAGWLGDARRRKGYPCPGQARM
jgi:hypothetical protein